VFMFVKSFLGVLVILFVLILPLVAEEEQSVRAPVYVIDIYGEIDRAMMVFIRRGIEEAKAARAEVVIFDIDTFGGRVDSALQITSLIGSLDSALTVAYVTSEPEGTGVSWSAGALIAFSCDRIYMAPGTSMGAAAPVYQTQEGMEMAPEKVVSALRAQMAALAEKNGYSKEIAVAMVDKDIELLEVYVNGELRVISSGDLETAQREALRDRKKFEKGKTLIQSGKLLALTAGEMQKYGVSSGTMPNLTSLVERLGYSDVALVSLQQNAPDKVVAMLTGVGFTSLIVIIGLIALFIEITTPGFGIPGTLAIVAFAILFISHSLLGTVGSVELLLFILGVVLLLLEIFIIPGFGVAGISGIMLIVISLVLAMQDFIWPVFDWQWDILRNNLVLVLVSLAVAFTALILVARFVPQITLFKGLMLTSTQKASEGYSVQHPDTENHLVGKKGVAITKLRPVGKAEIDGQVLVVEAEGEFLESGRSVLVTEINGNRIVVRGC
jgi:membrane-bound serine protease (ClpP class)